MKWVLLPVAILGLTFLFVGCSQSASEGPSAPPAAKKYVCSMDGGSRDTPGPCPKCGMKLP